MGVYEGLGFEDCSTEVVSVETGSYKWFPNMVGMLVSEWLMTSQNRPAQHSTCLILQEVSYRGWTFFKFNITDDDYEVCGMMGMTDIGMRSLIRV